MSAITITIQLILCVSRLRISYANEYCGTTSQMQQMVDNWMDAQAPGCIAAAFVTPKETNYFFAGVLGPENPHLPNEDTMFEIGSITKGFTALLLADRVLTGKVTLNDTLAELLTDWPGRHSSEVGSVTLLELATHSSGLPKLPPDFDYDSQNPYVNYTAKKLYRWLDKAVLQKRGFFEYSNVGFALLGHAMAIVEGKEYEDFLKERVISPLELRDTTITLNQNQTSRLAPGHNKSGTLVPSWEYQEIFKPMIALRSSVVNMAQFIRFAIRKNDSASQMDIRNAFEFTTDPHGRTYNPYITVGCCWRRLMLENCDDVFVYQDGLTGGYNAFIGWVPKERIGFVVLASTVEKMHTAVHLGFRLLGTYYNRNYFPIHQAEFTDQ